jgi:hypothetical protein
MRVMKNPGNRLSANRRQGRIAQQLSAKSWQFPIIFSEALHFIDVKKN